MQRAPGERATTKPSIRWRVPIAGVHVCPPTVVDGAPYGGGEDGLFALEAASGAERWRFPVQCVSYVPPVIADGVVYFLSPYGVYGLDAESGTERWHDSSDEAIKFPDPEPEAASLAVGFGLVIRAGMRRLYAKNPTEIDPPAYVWIDKSSNFIQTPAVARGDSIFYANEDSLQVIDPVDGNPIWEVESHFQSQEEPDIDGVVHLDEDVRGRYADIRFSNTLAFDNGSVALALAEPYGFSGALQVVDIVVGTTRWRTDVGLPNGGPTISDGVVMLAHGRAVSSFAAEDGAELWRVATGFTAPPAVRHGVVYLGTCRREADGTASGALVALEVASGSELWRIEGLGEGLGAPAVVGGVLYVGTTDLGRGQDEILAFGLTVDAVPFPQLGRG